MPLFEGFIGASYRTRSQSMAADACMNLYPEVVEIEQEAKHAFLYGTPGLKLFLTTFQRGNRGWFSEDGRTFTVVGSTLYEINTTLVTATILGTIPDDQKPVSFSTNGRGGEQLAIVGGGFLKILTLTTNVLSAVIALPLTYAPVQIDFMDGYFLLVEANSIRVWFSALENGSSWDALDFFAISQTTSNVVGIKVLHNRCWVGQQQYTSVYYDSGNADNPFLPYPGSVMEEGWVSPWGAVVLGEQVFWLAQDGQGRNRMVSAQDYAPKVISTPAISYALAQFNNDDVEVLAYEQEGHPFVIWTFTTGDQSWCFDVRENQWHQRDDWDQTSGTSHRWRARGACAVGNLILTGDYQTGDLYTLDLDTFANNGSILRRMRRAPYISSENQWVFVDQIEMGIQSGVGLLTGQGSDPSLMLAFSGDSGATWGVIETASPGATGKYEDAPKWYRCGRYRADRMVMEMTQTDPVRAAWGPGVWIRATPGTGQL